MDFEERNEPADERGYDIEIYSRSAVFWFTLLFTPLFGGTLLIINLNAAGERLRALWVVLFSLGFYIAENRIANFVKENYLHSKTQEELVMSLGLMSLVLNAIAGLILVFVFYNRYFPEKNYYPKSILTPVLVAVGLFLLSTWLAPMLISSIGM